MDELASTFEKEMSSSGTGAVHHGFGRNASKCKVVKGAPKNLNGILFSALLFFVDEDDFAHIVQNYYGESGLTGTKIPGGGAQEPILQDNIFQATIEQMMIVIGYDVESRKEALAMIELWNEDERLPHRKEIRAAFMEYLEETHCIPDLLDVVCHAQVSNQRGERTMVFVRAQHSYRHGPRGLVRIKSLSELAGGKSLLDKKTIETVYPIPVGDLTEKLDSKTHKAVVPELLAFKRPMRSF